MGSQGVGRSEDNGGVVQGTQWRPELGSWVQGIAVEEMDLEATEKVNVVD